MKHDAADDILAIYKRHNPDLLPEVERNLGRQRLADESRVAAVRSCKLSEAALEREVARCVENVPANTLSITLPLPPRELSPNSRCHWAKKARATKEARRLASLMAVSACAEAGRWTRDRFNIVLDWYHPTAKLPDADNCIAHAKAYLDGIADAMMVNDRQFVTSIGAVEKDAKRPRVELTIAPATVRTEAA